jgi:alpha-1,3-rhamnosyltransferase
VLETLESAKAQTYQNIELIISDDCSTDDTVKICKEWLAKNKASFLATKLISVKENTGVPANCNRGVYACKGTWVKIIAGDDVLFKDCVKDNILFANQFSNCCLIHSNFDSFGVSTEKDDLAKNRIEWRNKFFLDNNISQEKQFDLLHYHCPIAAPTVMMLKEAIIKVNGFDESIPLMEDMPMWLRLSKAGFKFYYMPKKTVGYRVHDESITSSSKELLFSVKFTRGIEIMYNKYTKKHYSIYGRFLRIMYFKIQYLMDEFGLNNKNIFSIVLYELFRIPVEKYKTKRINKIIGK